MVKGLETFRKAMQPYKEHFVIIGGTACDIQLTKILPLQKQKQQHQEGNFH